MTAVFSALVVSVKRYDLRILVCRPLCVFEYQCYNVISYVNQFLFVVCFCTWTHEHRSYHLKLFNATGDVSDS